MEDKNKVDLEEDMKITDFLLDLNKFYKEDFDLNKIKEIAYKADKVESNEPKQPSQSK